MVKKILFALLGVGCVFPCIGRDDSLRFNPEVYATDSITMPGGKVVRFKSYEGIFYVSNIEDSAYQQLNIYVPFDLHGRTDKEVPVLMRNNVGGYMASPAGTPSPADATGRRLRGVHSRSAWKRCLRSQKRGAGKYRNRSERAARLKSRHPLSPLQ